MDKAIERFTSSSGETRKEGTRGAGDLLEKVLIRATENYFIFQGPGKGINLMKNPHREKFFAC